MKEIAALTTRSTEHYPAPFGGHWLRELRRTPVHPETQCQCHEGRVTTRDGQFVRWLPGRHDCAYVLERDAALGDDYALALLAGLRASEGVAAMARAGATKKETR